MEYTKGHLVALVMNALEKEYGVDLEDFGQQTAIEIEDRIPLLKTAPDLLAALKRAYFLLETHNIKDDYFEVLRIKLGDLLPSQVEDIKLLAQAINNTK